MDLTIGVTCWNAEDSIIRALDSVRELSNSYIDYEVIIVDDASSDNTMRIVEEYITTHDLSYFSLFKLPKNKGVAGARNEILKHAKGEYFAFLDDDDEWLPSRYNEQKQVLLATEQDYSVPVLCYGGRLQKHLDGSTNHKSPLGYPNIVGGVELKNFFISGDKFDNPSLNPAGTGVLFSRLSTLQRLNGFDESFRRMEDVDLVIRHCDNGGVCVGTDVEVITQNLTLSEDKGFDKVVFYHKKLIRKHISIFSSRYIYSIIKMHKSVAYKNGNTFRSKIYLLISFFFSLENFKYNLKKIPMNSKDNE
ncbi:glycosyltransferase family 2 protein [Pseudoalteromonas sp. SWXJZ94C]|uniref:glycosyltransferase family 2 protein n=1 Tax=Pseudoalteromonas sp. SWXJZ94C TaxID=2792065 RepID=UPI0018CF0AF2|nr:glycosyltransferase family 2 protein [Pseudoalteromonas sp. SWXJZ94C]